jgi:hypothetical protein
MTQEANSAMALLKERRRECLIQARAYDLWLRVLTPIRWATITSGVVLPAVAGFTLLRGQDIFGIPWTNVSATLTFIASIVAALHNALHCEPHQTECRRLRRRFATMADDFETALSGDEKSLVKKRDDLNARLSQLKQSATEEPPGWCFDKANKEVQLS